MPDPDIFISYRRLDSGYFSQWLAAELKTKFGEHSIFIDARNIRDGDIWKSEIEGSLNSCRIVIVVIGRDWISTRDENGRRRIDLRDDWVRQEIELSLREKKKIIPLFIDDTPIPNLKALPSSIRSLLNAQAHRIHVGDILKQINEISSEIATFLGKRVDDTVHMPFPYLIGKIDPLDDDNLHRLTERLPGWEIVPRHDGKELTKKYLFESFEDVIHFMNTASRFISQYDHHPEWINIWRTLIVYLTTWDIGHKPTMLDVDVATYLDDLYKTYQRKVTKEDIIKLERERQDSEIKH
jgi:pterin-4a-carbinolamine dehydratase